MTDHGLPDGFRARMHSLLGEESAEFLASLQSPPVAGLRVNTLKIATEAFSRLALWRREPVPWCSDGFVLEGEARPGRHPLHAAGLFYLQEPSAMAAAEALDIQPGHLVLDLCASPGGKSTHIAAKLAGSGVLVSNEVTGSRIKPLGENLERWGAPNVVLTNDETSRLASRLGPVFDRVLLDAPCSGEGMFRKSPAAVRDWSLKHIEGSAERQTRILEDAAALLKPGGKLVYSTCTFAPEENEQQIARFLAWHPGWEIETLQRYPGVMPGRTEWTGTDASPDLARAHRFWPHRVRGEGHFVARLVKHRESSSLPQPWSESTRRPCSERRPTSAHVDSWREFAGKHLAAELPDWLRLARVNDDELVSRGGHLFSRASHNLDLDGLNVVRPGLCLGEALPGRFVPSHALALALRPEHARQIAQIDLDVAGRFLAGQTLHLPGENGWVLVVLDRWPLGWGRRSGDVIKNHYPKGLRWMA